MKRSLLAALLLGGLVACDSPTVDALVALDGAARAPEGSTNGKDGGSQAAHDDATTEYVPVFVDCADVFSKAHAGDACKLEKDCSQDLKCSRQIARCVNGVLFFSTEDGCPDCKDDLECGSQVLCIDGHCTACPVPKNCPACPGDYKYLTRNGCQTCECGPPPECVAAKAGCDSGYQCMLGAYCVQGCSRLDCCVNVCAEPGCAEPAPLGCLMECDDTSCDGPCKAEVCYCDLDTKSWTCKGFCAGDAASITPCKVP
jgi:hypothetical protein